MADVLNLDDENVLYIFGHSDDSIEFCGSLIDSIAAFNGRFRITAGDVIIHYEWNDLAGWCAQIVNPGESVIASIVQCDPDNPNETDPDEMVPVVIIPFKVDAVKIESLTVGGKCNGIEYLVNKSTVLTEQQQYLFERIDEISTDIRDTLTERYGEQQIKGFIYFNLK